MKIKNTGLVILIILILASSGIYAVNSLPLSEDLRNSIISEIIGSGILAAFVSAVFFYLQESGELKAQKEQSKQFINSKLKLDIKEANSRGSSLWNLSGGKKFYFDQSIANSLYDIYETNFTQISRAHALFPENNLLKYFSNFYRLVREGYVIAEKLDNIVNQAVRSHYHSLGIDPSNNYYGRSYIKGKLYAQLQDQEINKHLNKKPTPQHTTVLSNQTSTNPQVNELMDRLHKRRKKLMKISKSIVKLANE